MIEDRTEFASQRKSVLRDAEKLLLPVVGRALKNWGNGNWWEPILDALDPVFADAYNDIAGQRPADDRSSEIKEALGAALKLTEKPDNNTAAVIARLAAAAAVNGGTDAAAADDGALDLEWVTMHDTHVRETHRDADGQVRKVGEPFHIGESELDYPGDPKGHIEDWIGCRCVLRPTPSSSHSLLAGAMMAPLDPQGDEMTAPTDEAAPPAAAAMPVQIPWHGVLAVEGAKTGDGRSFSKGSLRNRDLPLPLTWQEVTNEGHSQSHVVGMIHGMQRQDNEDGSTSILGHGVFRTTPEADRAIGTVADFGKFGVSIDADDTTYEIDADNMAVNFTDARICGACLVHIPAFAEAYIQLGDAPWAQQDLGDGADDQAMAMIGLDGKVEMGRGPGWISDPKDTRRIHSYWTTPGQPGYRKIAWGTPGDFDRCRTEVGKYLVASGEPEFVNQTCAQWHHDALGEWPATHAKQVREGLTAAEAVSLVASAGTKTRPPVEAFTDPCLPCPTPITYINHEWGTRVVGHIAEWGVCHAAFPGQCVTAPQSTNGYADFMLGGVECAGGEIVRVGQITLGGGHADPNLGMRAALDHYDDVSTALVDIVVGEDAFGIWFSGVLRPWASERQRHELLAAKLSGDWREHGYMGPLEMIAAHAVNAPAFRVQASTLAGRQISLVAAGALDPGLAQFNENDLARIVAEGIQMYEETKAQKAAQESRLDQLEKAVGADKDSRLDRLQGAGQ